MAAVTGAARGIDTTRAQAVQAASARVAPVDHGARRMPTGVASPDRRRRRTGREPPCAGPGYFAGAGAFAA